MKAIKENWKLVLIVAAGIVAVIFYVYFWNSGSTKQSIRIGGTGQHCGFRH